MARDMRQLDYAELRTIMGEQPYPLLFATVSGAHLYGFPSRDSDVDLRGVHVLPAAEVVGLRHGPETLDRTWFENEAEVDLVTHDLAKFARLMPRRNGYVLEQVLSPLVVRSTPEHEQLVALAHGCITSGTHTTTAGSRVRSGSSSTRSASSSRCSTRSGYC